MRTFWKNFWKAIPSLRIVIGLIIGIAIEFKESIPLILVVIVGSIACLIAFSFRWIPLRYQFTYEWIRGLQINILCVCIGCFIAYYANIQHNKNWVGNQYQLKDKVILTLQEPLTNKAHTYKAIASIDAVYHNGKWEPVKGKALLYIHKDTGIVRLGYGSRIMTDAPLITIINAGNPGSFDYKQYCLFQGITHQSFLKTEQYVLLGNTIPSYLYYYLFKIRGHVLGLLKKNIPEKDAYGIAEALLIGYREDMDRDLTLAYSNTGVVHIIAISGMHLGMLYGTMVLFFSLFKKRKWVMVWIKPIVLLIVLWGFTLIAGAVPSILRSAFMFSFILFAGILDKRSNVYNTLSLSALCMILFNPFCIWDVGFQLSYAAVIGIIMFSKQVSGWIDSRFRVVQYVWDMCAVTISAQVWTFPLILYYFHQFPKLVLISNLIVVPVSCIILYAEIVLLFLAPTLSSTALYFGKAVQFSILRMNQFIQFMSSIKSGVWAGIKVSPLQTCLLFFLIAYLLAWIIYKQKDKLVKALAICTLLFMLRAYDYILLTNQNKLIVYNISNHTILELMNGTHTINYSDSSTGNDRFFNNYFEKPAHVENRTEIIAEAPLPDYIKANNQSIVILNKPIRRNLPISPPIPIDVLIITRNASSSLAQIHAAFKAKTIVIDGSVGMWKTEQMKKDNNRLHLPLYSTPDSGAFIVYL